MSGMHAETADPNDVVGRARTLADELLFPRAQDVDRGERVPAESLTALHHRHKLLHAQIKLNITLDFLQFRFEQF